MSTNRVSMCGLAPQLSMFHLQFKRTSTAIRIGLSLFITPRSQ